LPLQKEARERGDSVFVDDDLMPWPDKWALLARVRKIFETGCFDWRPFRILSSTRQAMRLSTYDKPRVIACAKDHLQHIGLPRGCLDDVHRMLTDLRVRTAIRDERYAGRPLEVTFGGERCLATNSCD
jgi:hypothetical protein